MHAAAARRCTPMQGHAAHARPSSSCPAAWRPRRTCRLTLQGLLQGIQVPHSTHEQKITAAQAGQLGPPRLLHLLGARGVAGRHAVHLHVQGRACGARVFGARASCTIALNIAAPRLYSAAGMKQLGMQQLGMGRGHAFHLGVKEAHGLPKGVAGVGGVARLPPGPVILPLQPAAGAAQRSRHSAWHVRCAFMATHSAFTVAHILQNPNSSESARPPVQHRPGAQVEVRPHVVPVRVDLGRCSKGRGGGGDRWGGLGDATQN